MWACGEIYKRKIYPKLELAISESRRLWHSHRCDEHREVTSFSCGPQRTPSLTRLLWHTGTHGLRVAGTNSAAAKFDLCALMCAVAMCAWLGNIPLTFLLVCLSLPCCSELGTELMMQLPQHTSHTFSVFALAVLCKLEANPSLMQ
jgi:hypothetical protein